MAETLIPVEPEHHIPVPKHVFGERIVGFAETDDERSKLGDLWRMLEGIYHFECHEVAEQLKRDYSLFDPVEESVEKPAAEEIAATEERFLDGFIEMMRRANFVPLSQQDIDEAIAEDYLFTLPVEIDWDAHDSELLGRYFHEHPYGDGSSQPPNFSDKALVFRRGVGVDATEGLLFVQKLDLLVNRLLMFVLRFPGRLFGWLGRRGQGNAEPMAEPDSAISSGGSGSIFDDRVVKRITLHAEDVNPLSLFRRTRLQEPTFRQLVLLFRRAAGTGPAGEANVSDRAIYIKTFREIPMADLEVVFPEKRLSMKPVDLIKLISTAATGIVIVAFKIAVSVTINPLLLVILLGSLVAYAGRTVLGYKTSRDRYRHLVTHALYDKSLDNGLGVILYLVDCMEEQELKEVALGWVMLRQRGSSTAADLNRACEEWLHTEFGVKTDFEIADALEKLEREGFIKHDGGRYEACPLDEALERLDHKWDNFFSYNQRSASSGDLNPTVDRRQSP